PGCKPVDGGADREGAGRAELAGIVVGGRGPIAAPVPGRQPPPPGIEVDHDLLDPMALPRESLGDGRPGHDRYVVLGRRTAEQDDDRRQDPGVVAHGAASQPAQSPTNSISKASSTPCRARTSARTRPARRRTPAARPCWSCTRKLACFSETTAPPTRSPFNPAASISRPAESPDGLRKTLPADGSPSGWWACRQRRIP